MPCLRVRFATDPLPTFSVFHSQYRPLIHSHMLPPRRHQVRPQPRAGTLQLGRKSNRRFQLIFLR
jgi:hypothetical protein